MSEQSRPVDVSVVAPVFNERDNLRPLVDELLAVLRPTARPFEIVLVDDGSQDGSAAAIDALAAAHPEVRGVHCKANCGQTAAFDAGFRARLFSENESRGGACSRYAKAEQSA